MCMLLGSWGAVCSHFPRLLRSTELGCGRVGGSGIAAAIRRLPRPPCAEACLRRRCRPPGEKPAKWLIALRLKGPLPPPHPHTLRMHALCSRCATWRVCGLGIGSNEPDRARGRREQRGLVNAPLRADQHLERPAHRGACLRHVERHSFAAAACASLVFIGLHVLRTAFCVLIKYELIR